MKDLVNKLLANLHWVILVVSLYNFYVKYEEHTAAVDAIQTQINSLNTDKAATEKKVSEIQDNIAKIDEFKIRVAEVAKNIEAVQKQLPAEINDSQINDFLVGEMSTLNIKDRELVPGKETASTYFMSRDFNLKAKGTFLQFLIFFERIGNADRIYNVKTLKMINNTDTKKGRFQIVEAESVIQAFRYNPDFKVDLGFENPQGQVKK